METIIKIRKRQNPFVQIDRRIPENQNLTWKAKGLLSYLLSRPDDWNINMTDLVKRSLDSTTSVKSGIKELKKNGYVQSICFKNHKGQIYKWEYVVYEVPIEDTNIDYVICDYDKNGILKNLTKKYFKNKNNTNHNDNMNFVNNPPQVDFPIVDDAIMENPIEDNPPPTNKELTNNEVIKNNINNEEYKTLSNTEVVAIKSDMEVILKTDVDVNILKNFIKKNKLTIDKIKHYLQNWHKFDFKSKDNPTGFFLSLVKRNVAIPKKQEGQYSNNKPIQSTNFDQRVYDDEFFDSLYDNFKT